jgi:hypothetical protein
MRERWPLIVFPHIVWSHLMLRSWFTTLPGFLVLVPAINLLL